MAMPLLAPLLLLAAQPPSGTLAPPLIGGDTPPEPMPGTAQPPTQPAGRDAVAVDAGEADVPIRRVRFVGVDAPAPVAEAAREFIGRPASRETLDLLARAVAAAYGRTGIALYTIAVPRQDLSTGEVKLLLAEGFIEDSDFPKGASPLVRAYAGRLQRERPLTRRTMERYISLIRDIPGAKADIAMLRGTAPGGVRLSIVPTREHVDFSFGLDNRTQSGLGSGQMRATARGYSLLRDGDRTDLVLIGALDLKRYRYGGLSHQTPLGSDGLTLALSASHLTTRLKNLPVRGQAQTAGLSLSYPVIRGYRRNLTVSVGLDGLDSDAAFLGAVISSDHIRAVRAAAGYAMVGEKSALSAGITISRGLDILGARGTPGFTDPVFTKATARGGYDRMIGRHVIGRLRLLAQHSGDRLSGNERMAVGGADFGRAFDTALVSGDRGAAASVELAYRPSLPDRMKGSELYGFVDGARVRVKARNGFAATSYDLASAGGGIRLVHAPQASLSLEGARVIDKPFAGADGGWRFNISWQLKLGR